VITFNPPYTDKKASDLVEVCFWDKGNKTTKRFFKEFKKFLKPNGKAYLAWGEFGTKGLLEELSLKYKVKLKKIKSRVGSSGLLFHVFQLLKEENGGS
jgi:methylase of polypeptide subunit release factors